MKKEEGVPLALFSCLACRQFFYTPFEFGMHTVYMNSCGKVEKTLESPFGPLDVGMAFNCCSCACRGLFGVSL